MQTLFIGFVEDSIYPPDKGLSIRMAYLLSTHFVLSGNFAIYFEIDQGFRNISFERKIKYVDECESVRPDGVQFYPQYKEFKKVYSTARNTKPFIVFQKRMERVINNVFNRLVDEMLLVVKRCGVYDLKSLYGSSGFTECYVRHDFPEKKEEDCYRMSDILLLRFNDDNGLHTLYVLNDSIFKEDFDPEHIMMPTLNEYSDKGFLFEMFTFSNFNIFTIADLNAIKFETNESLHFFQRAVNSFCDLHKNPSKAFDFLQNNVLSAADKLIETINATRLLLNHRKALPKDVEYGKLYLGMLPRSVVFKYYKFINALKDATLDILDHLPEDEQSVLTPVIIVENTYFDSLKDQTVNTVCGDEIILKKSFEID